MKKELKPCPFCGSEPCAPVDIYLMMPGLSEMWEIKCTNIGCRCLRIGATREEVIKAWNTRVDI